MSKRKTVALNLEFVNAKIKEKCRSNVVFCEMMGRPDQKTWVTDWNRKDRNTNEPTPKNLPSPEEAARMCAILNAMPEEFLTEQADIDMVTALINEEVQKGAKAMVGRLMFGQKERPTPVSESGLSEKDIRLARWFRSLPPETQKAILTLGDGPKDLSE